MPFLRRPIQASKVELVAPARSDKIVERQRLLDRFANSGVRQLYVCAPFGYGKTAFLVAWHNTFTHGQVWLGLKKVDNDLQQFFSHFVEAVRYADQHLAMIDVDFGFGENNLTAEDYVTCVIDWLNKSSARLYVAIDNYHVIQDRQLQQAIEQLLHNLPNRISVVVASCRAWPKSLASLLGQHGAIEYGAEDLGFTEQESAQYCNSLMQLGLSNAEIVTLHTTVEGWPAALALMATSLQKAHNRRQLVQSFPEESSAILEPLLRLAMTDLEADAQAFLVEISILDSFNAELCDAVTGRSDSEKMLEDLKLSQMIFSDHDCGQSWYKHWTLLSRMLCWRMERKAPDLCSQLYGRAARWHAANKHYLDALEFAAKGKDVNLLAELLETHTREIFSHGRMQPGSTYLYKLPKDLIYSRPRLSLLATWCAYFRGDPLRMEQYIIAVENGIRTASLHTGLSDEHQAMLGQLMLLRACQSRYAGNLEQSIKLAKESLENLPIGGDYYRAAEVNLGICYLCQGKLAEAEHLFMRSADISRLKMDFMLGILANIGLARIQIIRSSLSSAQNIYSAAIEQMKQHNSLGSPAGGVLQMAAAEVAYECNDLERASELLQNAVGLLEVGGMEHMKALSEALLTRIKIARGEVNLSFHPQWEEAITRYIERPAYEVVHYLTHLAHSWLAQGRVDSVLLALGQSHTHAISPEHEATHLIFARLLLAQKRQREALKLLGQLKQQAVQLGRLRPLAEIHLLSALAHENIGQRGLALLSLQQALSLGEKIGCLRLFLDEGVKLESLMQHLGDKADTPYLKLVMEHTRRRPQTEEGLVALAGLLSAKEYEVAKHLASALSNQEIAQAMFVSLNTVKTHIRNIFRKLNVKNRLQAAEQIWKLYSD